MPPDSWPEARARLERLAERANEVDYPPLVEEGEAVRAALARIDELEARPPSRALADALDAQVQIRLEAESRLAAVLALCEDRERIGRLMHESWCATKRAQGWHGPDETCRTPVSARLLCGEGDTFDIPAWCRQYHPDIVTWDRLPAERKARAAWALDAILPEIRRAATGEGVKG